MLVMFDEQSRLGISNGDHIGIAFTVIIHRDHWVTVRLHGAFWQKIFSKNFVCDLGSHFITPGPAHMGREALKHEIMIISPGRLFNWKLDTRVVG